MRMYGPLGFGWGRVPVVEYSTFWGAEKVGSTDFRYNCTRLQLLHGP
jgi:hypothetical protein